MNKDTWRQLYVVLATVVTIVINTLANALPINGLNTGEISDRFAIFFVPAGYVFSIWGLIYLALIGYTVYQALPSQRENPRLRRIGIPYALSAAANSLWVLLWHYEQFILTVPVMLALLALLITIYLRLKVSRVAVPPAERWLVHATFGIYLGWISVATVANVSQTLFFLGWGGLGIAPQVWAAILLVVATVLGALMLWLRRDVPYALVLVWAFIGIALKHWSASTLVGGVAWVAAAAVAVMAAAVVATHLKARTQPTA
ncbi:MAG: tryptophan-rich sensory protein [Chloroflexi bacterium]|nr:tryptophan-rich sensory protein [Chloroflexota bacterium]